MREILYGSEVNREMNIFMMGSVVLRWAKIRDYQRPVIRSGSHRL